MLNKTVGFASSASKNNATAAIPDQQREQPGSQSEPQENEFEEFGFKALPPEDTTSAESAISFTAINPTNGLYSVDNIENILLSKLDSHVDFRIQDSGLQSFKEEDLNNFLKDPRECQKSALDKLQKSIKPYAGISQ